MRFLFFLVLLTTSPAWAEPLHTWVRDNQVERVGERLEQLRSENPELLAATLERRVQGFTPLHVAARAGQLKMCELLLLYGAPMEARDQLGNPPLWSALAEGHEEVVALLRERGAGTSGVNTGGETVVMLAARRCGPRLLGDLLQDRVALEAEDGRGRTALHHAVEGRQRANALFLLEQGATIDIRDHEGRSPLLKAVSMGDRELVSFLLSQGADPELRDARGRDAFRLAQERGDWAMSRLLHNGPPALPKGSGEPVSPP